jgi:alpha-tubulin suppressor-like RCC1 family protein
MGAAVCGFTCNENYVACGTSCCDPGTLNQSHEIQTAPSTLAVGAAHVCVIAATGEVMCWGDNRDGQLGRGTKTAENRTPASVVGLNTDALSISAGTSNTCALLKNKTVKCWGYDLVGNQATDQAKNLTPVAITGISDVAQIASGNFHTCALLGNGSIRCWGNNTYGQLGSGVTSESEAVPVYVKGITDAVRIGLGGFHSCAIVKDGTVECWGRNSELQVGAPAFSESVTTPTIIAGVTNALTLSAGGTYSCALTNKSVKCWGSGVNGLLGDGKNLSRANAEVVTALGEGPLSIGAGYNHACAIVSNRGASNGGAKCWGVGLAGSPDTNMPVNVQGLSIGATEVVSGNKFSCARAGISIKCWGDNTFGQLGDGTTENHPAAVDVNGL